MPRIYIKTGEKKGMDIRLTGSEISIGRDPSNTIVLPDRRVSRAHASIIKQGDDYVVEDLGSVNGIQINNEFVSKKVLHYGDEIQLGGTVLSFLSVGTPGAGSLDKDATQIKEIPDEKFKEMTVEAKVIPENLKELKTVLSKSDLESLQKAYQRLMTLYQISHDLGTVVELPELLDTILGIVMEVTKADRGFIMLIDEETHELNLKAVRRKKGLEREEIALSRTLINQVRETGESILTRDASQDSRFKEAESIILHGIRSTMCVPIKFKDTILGVMQVDTKAQVASFTKDDLELLTSICTQAAVAIENAKLFDSLRQANIELKEQQNQLIEAEKLSALGKLAGGVAHEINNPMTSILGYSELASTKLKQESLSPKEHRDCAEYIKIVEEEAHRCQRIAQTLLQFGRRKEERKTSININEVIEASLAIARFHIKKVHIEIVKELDENIPSLMGDANQLQQVFLNFIVNARDAMEEGGTLTISTASEGDKGITVKFADTGCGIPEDKLEEIFKPLYTSKEEGKGTGLGLSISQDIIEAHKGTIEVESSLGRGTTFIIRLPQET